MSDEPDISQLISKLRELDGVSSVTLDVTVTAKVQKDRTEDSLASFNPVRERVVDDEQLSTVADECGIHYVGVVDAMNDFHDAVRFKGSTRYDD